MVELFSQLIPSVPANRPCPRSRGATNYTSRPASWLVVMLVLGKLATAQAPQPLTWPAIRARFEANNPTLLAEQTNVDEAKAQEITAYLRPNPDFTMTLDGTQIAPYHGIWQPFAGTFESPAISYLHERRHKRELRLESAKRGTTIEQWNYADLERSLLFNLRSAFVSTLRAKAVLQLAKDNLAYYDHVLQISRDRFSAGDIAQVDLDRLELQRVQYESDVQTADVNLRTAKIQLLTLLNARTPIDQFDVIGTFEFSDQLLAIEEYRRIALDTRPDLKSAIETVNRAEADHKLAVANGSTDPIFSAWYTHNSSNNNPFGINTLGVSVSVPLRIFDRNQGEKLRTQLDVTRTRELREATEATVLSDVDSGYATLQSSLSLLRPYKQKYLGQATRVRDTIFFSYQHGGASLLDFMNAQSEYRSVQLSYVNLVGSYLTAAAQLNMAVGQEVIP
jgi:cobalt-zinc-cadmium efflux system outer membrane protein